MTPSAGWRRRSTAASPASAWSAASPRPPPRRRRLHRSGARRGRRPRQAPADPLRRRAHVARPPAHGRVVPGRAGRHGAGVAPPCRAVDRGRPADRARRPRARGRADRRRGPHRRPPRARSVRAGAARSRRGPRPPGARIRPSRSPAPSSTSATSPASATSTPSSCRSSSGCRPNQPVGTVEGLDRPARARHRRDPHERRPGPAEHDGSQAADRRPLDLRPPRPAVPAVRSRSTAGTSATARGAASPRGARRARPSSRPGRSTWCGPGAPGAHPATGRVRPDVDAARWRCSGPVHDGAMDIGPGELIVVLLVVLLIFGSTRLPALGKSLGEAMREVRHWSDDDRDAMGLRRRRCPQRAGRVSPSDGRAGGRAARRGRGGGSRRRPRRRRRGAARGARRGVGVDGPDRGAGREHVRRPRARRASAGGAVEVVPARRRDDHDLGPAPGDRRPTRRPTESPPGCPSTAVAARGRHQVGHPVTGRERRVGPLQHATCVRRGRARHGRRRSTPAGRRHRSTIAAARSSVPVASPTVVIVSITSSSVDGSSVSTSAEQPSQADRVVDLGDVDGAHRAQVLGDRPASGRCRRRRLVELVEVLAGGDPLLDDGIDLAGRQALGQRRTSTRSASCGPRRACRTRTSRRRRRRRARAANRISVADGSSETMRTLPPSRAGT